MSQTRSVELFRRAQKVIPGGVNSPVRAFKAVGTKPIFVSKAKGPYVYDADGNRFIDYCLSWGPLILGHAQPQVLKSVRTVMARGTSFGIPTELETKRAEMIVQAIDKIIKFIGCYHGHVDHMLVQAGSGATTLGIPSSPGVPKDFTKHTVLLPYNDAEAAEKAFDKQGGRIAAVIVEPIAGNMGVVPPEPGFLKALRNACTRCGSVLIFDEVITGFRVQYGSVQGLFRVKADLTCLGKIIGGGFPIGACGGKSKIMNHLAPQGRVYQAGTLSGNPICVAAGIATLEVLKKQNPYSRLNRLTQRLCSQIGQALGKVGVEHTINQVGSMFTLFFNPGPVTNYASAVKSDTGRYARFFKAMLKAGIYLPPSQFEACFLSATHTQKDVAETAAAVRHVRF